MFRTIANPKDITRRISRQYSEQIAVAGPVMGALLVDAFIESLPAPPSPSVAAAHLTDISFCTWKNISKRALPPIARRPGHGPFKVRRVGR
jgi:hypothetical protein